MLLHVYNYFNIMKKYHNLYFKIFLFLKLKNKIFDLFFNFYKTYTFNYLHFLLFYHYLLKNNLRNVISLGDFFFLKKKNLLSVKKKKFIIEKKESEWRQSIFIKPKITIKIKTPDEFISKVFNSLRKLKFKILRVYYKNKFVLSVQNFTKNKKILTNILTNFNYYKSKNLNFKYTNQTKITTEPTKITTQPTKITTQSIGITQIKITTQPTKITTEPTKITTQPTKITTQPIKINQTKFSLIKAPSRFNKNKKN